MLLVLILFVGTSAQECFDDGNEFCIDQNDILSVDLLPGSFLFMDQKKNENNVTSQSTRVDGTFDKAINAMGFHRKMMNEYLCHGFVAGQILTEVGSPRVKRRLDALPKNSLPDFLGENNISIHDKLLSDQGSSKYKDWLQKTTMLDDIYRHYAPSKKTRKKPEVDRRGEDGEEYDGEVTGYAMQAPLPSGKVGGYFEPSGGEHMPPYSLGHHSHYGDYYSNHGEFYYPPVHEEHYYSGHSDHDDEHQEYHHKPSHHFGKGKGHHLSLRDFFEIALTALALLSFGLFLIQLLMNVKNASTATAAAIFQGDIDGTRYKRDASSSPLSYSDNHELNELSHRVLRSIEAALVTEQDGGNCLRRTLCEDNRYSKETVGGRRMWVPVWSLGMSWVSGRMLWRTPWSATLDSVKAAVLGLGGADCVALYPDCDLRRESVKRRRLRRK